MARKWLKKLIGKSRQFITIMKRLRGEMRGKRISLRRKYEAKINHLKKEREKIIEKKLEVIPKEIEKYKDCKIFSKENMMK